LRKRLSDAASRLRPHWPGDAASSELNVEGSPIGQSLSVSDSRSQAMLAIVEDGLLERVRGERVACQGSAFFPRSDRKQKLAALGRPRVRSLVYDHRQPWTPSLGARYQERQLAVRESELQ